VAATAARMASASAVLRKGRLRRDPEDRGNTKRAKFY
jgi:hypothetical protein